MFNGDKSKSYMNHWPQWAIEKEKEQLFYEIHSLVKDMIEQTVPPIVERYLKEYLSRIGVNFSATINGKPLDLPNVREAIIKDIQDEVDKIFT